MTAATLHSQFEEQARSSPDRIALWHNGTSIRYGELDAAADRFAGLLRSRGAEDGSFVGVRLDRSLEYVVATLGILKNNSAVVPLPPSYPDARVHEILAFADLAAVVDTGEMPMDRQFSDRIVRFDDVRTHGNGHRSRASTGDQPAFVLCSSGSTGKPKMIVRSHASFQHRLHWTWDQHPFRADEACVQKSFMTTTHAIYELFEPLLRGIPVHIVSDQEVRDLDSFWDSVRTLGVTRLLITPSLLHASLDRPGFVPPPLRHLVLMGEHVSPALAGRAIESFPEATQIFSIYGTTEASSTLVCDVRASYHPNSELPLGEPIASDVKALVLNDALAPVAPGDVGMLYLAGPALFSEYFKDPELTASSFITKGEKLFRTADQVRRLANGQLQFVARADDTVKIRGFRVDLREVERTTMSHPEVHQTVALAYPRSSGSSSIVLFVKPGSVTPGSVMEMLRETLAPYMLPTAVVSLDSFPILASGKVDRRGLLEEYLGRASAAVLRQFASETERRVAEVWRDVLGHADLSSQSNFFDVGGTSLLVFAAVHRLRTGFSLSRQALGDVSIYRYPTLGSLAAHIDAVLSGAAPVERDNSILVTLRQGQSDLEPFFFISSAGGTLGAYAKLTRALQTKREIIGIRDPFNWDDRDPTLGFQTWARRYVDAIRARQPEGPYFVVAYSSAGAPGYEVARQLRAAGQEVALLALIDPLALDRASKWRFGYWALEARFMRKPVRMLVRLAGKVLPVRDRGPSNWTMTRLEFEQLADRARNNSGYIRMLSSLLELNTGLPFALTSEEQGSVKGLLEKVQRVAPETDLDLIEHIVVQYEMQVRAQHNYRLTRYDGTVVLLEPESPWRGIVPAQLRPYVRNLRAEALPIGSLDQRLLEGFPHSMRTHYLSMRDDLFVGELAKRLSALLV